MINPLQRVAVGARIDLGSVTHATQLGPNFVGEHRGRTEDSFYGSEDDRQLRTAWYAGEASAEIQVGDKVRFLGGWIHDSPILDMWRSGSGFNLVLSDDWTTNLSHWFSDRVGKGKVVRCNNILPLRFEFMNITHLSCHYLDHDSARLYDADCVRVLKIAEEYLWTQVIAVDESMIQMAMNVWAWKVSRTETPYMVILIEAQRLRIHDRRRKAWIRLFGDEHVHIFDAAEEVWLREPAL